MYTDAEFAALLSRLDDQGPNPSLWRADDDLGDYVRRMLLNRIKRATLANLAAIKAGKLVAHAY